MRAYNIRVPFFWLNRLIGIASEGDVFVHTAQDIMDVTNNETKEKARLANAFVLTPLQEPVRGWFNIALNLGAKEHLKILGIDADGDSKFKVFF